jgi:hypothetical protein
MTQTDDRLARALQVGEKLLAALEEEGRVEKRRRTELPAKELFLEWRDRRLEARRLEVEYLEALRQEERT